MFFENSNHQNSTHYSCLVPKSCESLSKSNNNHNDNSMNKTLITSSRSNGGDFCDLTRTTTNQQQMNKDDNSLTLSLSAYRYCHGNIVDDDMNSLSFENHQPMTTDYYASNNNNHSKLVPKPAPRKIYGHHKNQQFSYVDCSSLVVKQLKENLNSHINTAKSFQTKKTFDKNYDHHLCQQHPLKFSNFKNENSLKSLIQYHSSSKNSDFRTNYLMNCLPPNQSLHTNIKTTSSKLLSGNNSQGIKQNVPTTTVLSTNCDAALSSNNDISSTDDDTEDSTDKNDKPKPGKLDLSQFDNITNAIGKLNIKPQKIRSSSETQSKFSLSQKSNKQDTTNQESGFFKNRTKKTKNRALESSKGETIDSLSGSNKSEKISSNRERKSESKVSSVATILSGKSSSSIKEQQPEQHSEIIRIHSSKNDAVKQRKFNADKDDIRSNIKEKLANFKSNDSNPSIAVKSGKVSGIASTFVQQQQSDTSSLGTDTSPSNNGVGRSSKPLPKPAPRSATTVSVSDNQQATIGTKIVCSNTSTSQTSSFGTSSTSCFSNTTNSGLTAATTTTPTSSSNSSSTVSAAISSKRINNPRQNHGRAVAPPQLPPVSAGSNDQTKTSSEQLSYHDLNKQLSITKSIDDDLLDVNQSPITQRLLQYSKDHKVSELNSPYESDSETTQQSNISKSQKQLLKGQSLSYDTNNPTNSSIDSSELINSRGAAIRQLNEILANKQPPGRFGGPPLKHASSSSQDKSFQEGEFDQQQSSSNSKKNDKEVKKDKKKLRDDEKMEKRRLKEEERLKRQEKKLEKSKKSKSSLTAESVGDDGIPLFIKRCIEFIEQEGLDAEGIYRVPGNRAHVDAFVQKFKENPNMCILESDIPVNAVATALKDFLSKKWGPIIPVASMNILTELSNISDRDQRVEAVRDLIKKLPQQNYNLLKYVFSHFVKVSHNHSLNSMDSKNLAICWWPTLLPLHFNDMIMFEQMRPHLEESIQTMIDQYNFVFDDDYQTDLAPPIINNQ